ncbi:MAG: RidA family protein, partial [Chloroflexota bacterium]
MPTFKLRGVKLPEGEYGIPPQDPNKPVRKGKSRWGIAGVSESPTRSAAEVGRGRAVVAGGMAYVSSVGPIDPETGEVTSGDIKTQARQCIDNLKATLEELGSSLDEIVWANWSLRESSEFDTFYEEWLRAFPSEAPVGQGTLMPLSQRRAGFRVSIGVIAATQTAPGDDADGPARIPAVTSAQGSQDGSGPDATASADDVEAPTPTPSAVTT